ncbi:MAG: PadR family transcriptional regulator [Acidimicrobiia bacterium]|nr:PadR family transcriptional regulator [Acidimicrobiia bacterium]
MPPKMTTSSYAVLAILDLRPWSGYELTHQAKRSLRYAWPRSERLLYSEPKKLVRLGYATVRKEEVGGRSRKVYTITDAGREALGEWASTRTSPPQLESEALLRFLFADSGSLEDLGRALDELEEDVGELHRSVVDLMASYLDEDEGHPFPDRAHLSVVFAVAQLELFRAFERWIEFARSEAARWPDTAGVGMDDRIRAITEMLARDESPVGELEPSE